ncbi:MAG: hypothetical protein LQ347_001912 [Umbilicaria vellea]|nr:MAG: hypothetical protein LQ347_001912 [Umbilicaria vellea]
MSGFSATIIEAPEVFANSKFYVPHNHYKACQAYPMKYHGNAAGNTHDPLNLTGSNTEPSATDYGADYPPTAPVSSRKKRTISHPYSPRSPPRSYDLWDRSAEHDSSEYNAGEYES